jgi:hypothetical protein
VRAWREADKEGILRVHLEIQDNPQFVEQWRAHEIGLVEDDNGHLALGRELADAVLDLLVEE